MKVMLFGASGMLGQGVLRECLRAHDVEQVLVVGRSALALAHPRLVQLVQPDLFALAPLQARFAGFDACFFCLGASASGTDEAGYTRTNHDLPLAVAQVLVRANPQMRFVYVSGQGTDATEQGRVMWARVKGRTENALSRLGFGASYMLRPGLIFALNGEVSRTPAYRLLYGALGWLRAPLQALFPNAVLDTAQIGQAMLQAARAGHGHHVLEPAAIHRLAAAARGS
jgi:uncharacterized protein YbjT (DUF2867 family)